MVAWLVVSGCILGGSPPPTVDCPECGDPTGGSPPSAVDCAECADLIEHGYCAATGTCGPIDGTGCPWGLIQTDSECEDPRRHRPSALPVDCRQISTRLAWSWCPLREVGRLREASSGSTLSSPSVSGTLIAPM